MGAIQRIRRSALAGGPLLALAVWALLTANGLEQPAARVAAITAWTAIWWVFEPIPIPATSILPFALLPLAGILTHEQVATAYGHHVILLLLGGFVLSTAMEKSGAHRRLALGMVHLVGGESGRRLVLGFMAAAGLLSMWISNTATTLMLLPVAMAVLDQVVEDRERLAVPLLLGIAYASNVGGVGTPIGTPPNLIFLANYETATGTSWTFLEWMRVGTPVVLVFVPLIWLWLTRGLLLRASVRVPHPGPWRAEEVRVLALFLSAAVLWITRSEPFGGWNGLLETLWGVHPSGGKSMVGDSTVALLLVVAMFVVPNARGGRLLDWETAVKIPWGLLLLFGGGLAIGKAFGASGLSEALGTALQGLTAWHVVPMIGALCLAVTFLTEVTSNTATTNILMPILAAAAAAAGVEPSLLMVPAAISASCAFMLPVATAPNAVVFGLGAVTTERMVREGFALNLIGAVVVTTISWFLLA